MTGRRTAGRVWESFLFGALLALVGGFLDAYTYCTRGGVFANSQTGNMALLGISLVRGSWRKGLDYCVPILAYALGVLAAEVNRCYRRTAALSWRQRTLLVEIALVGVVAALPARGDLLANILVSMLCAVQAQSFRKIHGVSYVNTTCSGNLRSAVELFYRFARRRDRVSGRGAAIYAGIIAVFILGVLLGALCSGSLGQRAILLCLLPLLCLLVLLARWPGEAGWAQSG